MLQQQDSWTCQQEWRQAGKQQNFLLWYPFIWAATRRCHLHLGWICLPRNSPIKKSPSQGLVLLMTPKQLRSMMSHQTDQKATRMPILARWCCRCFRKPRGIPCNQRKLPGAPVGTRQRGWRDNAYCLPLGSLVSSITECHHCTKTVRVVILRKKELDVCYSSPHYRDKWVPKCIIGHTQEFYFSLT